METKELADEGEQTKVNKLLIMEMDTISTMESWRLKVNKDVYM
jgi:hypothetical protein